MNYLDKLNQVQREAASETEGPIMIIAGAGSGKTRVLTYRIAHLLHKGVDAFNILSLTFTNKAAKEMKDRIAEIVGGTQAQNIWAGTFHSIFAKILRFEAEKIGFIANFTIYDTDDSKSLIKTILKELGLDDKIYKPALVYNRISSAKNNLISSSSYINNKEITNEDKLSGKPRIGDIYQLYQKRLFKSSAMDFDDLLFNTNVLLRDHPDVLHKYQHKFKYIMVDEYQDTNYSQYVIVKKLAALNENLCVVGDDAQSIYAFRGANIQNILNFKTDYPDLKVYKLEQNYRSTKNIVEAANDIISKNKNQLKKDVWTDNEIGEKISLIKAQTDNEEGTQVARSIFETKMNNQISNGDFAILYRTNAQSRAMEEALRKSGIAYKIYGGLSFYHRKEIKDLLAYFRLTINNNDEEAFKRIINYPARGIGQTTQDKIIMSAGQSDRKIWDMIENLNQDTIGLNSGAIGKVNEFKETIKSFKITIKNENAYEAGHRIAVSSGILKELHSDKTPEGISRHENIQELLNGLKEFSEKKISEGGKGTLDEFMEEIALLTDSENDKNNNEPKVSLMTIHAAKGLEFPYVYIVGLEENLFPSQMSLNSRDDLEEERRLFYVAITRAEKKATLSYSTTRYKWGNLAYCEPSRFLKEINEKYIETTEKSKDENLSNVKKINLENNINKSNLFNSGNFTKVKKEIGSDESSFISDDLKILKTGMNVEHQRFGIGRVMDLEGEFPNKKATVFFQNAGEKHLLLQFAKLKIID